MGSRSSANGQGGTLGPIDPAEVPKAVRVNDLLALQGPSEKTDHASRASTPGASPGSAAADVQAGDILHLTGWVHRILACSRQHVPPVRQPKPALWSPSSGRHGPSPRPGKRFARRPGAAPDGADLHQTAAATAARTFASRLSDAASDLCATDGPAVGSCHTPYCAFTRETIANRCSTLGDPPSPGGRIRNALRTLRSLTIAVSSLSSSVRLVPSRKRYNTDRTRPPSTSMVVPVI